MVWAVIMKISSGFEQWTEEEQRHPQSKLGDPLVD
jgi:hypothetical protein